MHYGIMLLFSFWLAIQLSALGGSASDRARANALFGTPQVLDIKIEISPEAMRSLKQQPRVYVLANIRQGDTVYTNVHVRIRGSAGSFRPVTDKPGLTIKIDKGAQRFHGLKKFHLNNSVQDRTYLNEWICDDMFRSAGVPSLRVTHAWVELNGRTLGPYLLKESFNEDFLAQYFKNTKGNLYGQSGGADVNRRLYQMRGKAEDAHADLRALAAAAQESDPAQSWQRLEEVLDVDRFLSFMAMEVMLCHGDGYTFGTHNFRVYHDLDTGKMVFFPHDMDQMLGDSNRSIIPQTGALVVRAVMRSAEGRTRYRERFGLLFTNVFQPASLNARIDEYVSAVAPALRERSARLATDFQAGARNLKERIRNRAAGIEKQLIPAKPLAFENNVARIQTWRKRHQPATSEMSEAAVDGRPVLRILCAESAAAASWRANVLLEAGRYRFSGRARLAGVIPRTGAPRSGVFLRVAHGPRQEGLSGDTDWESVQHEFSIQENQREIVLVCELYALEGEVLFDKDSLQLERLP
ncbi:MAG: CotH kinase family protein [Verrucomicrobiales bacterium]|nr:CotH kinase family protein [Verrucomicrobiales bacterium]